MPKRFYHFAEKVLPFSRKGRRQFAECQKADSLVTEMSDCQQGDYEQNTAAADMTHRAARLSQCMVASLFRFAVEERIL